MLHSPKIRLKTGENLSKRYDKMGCSRLQSSFEAVWKARKLAGLVHDDNFLPVYASANIKILPYQIAAARFALRSGNLKGCILCDEGSLGKTYEALLVVSQRWYEGNEHILIVLPQNLISQWQSKLTEEFNLPLIDWAEYTQESQGVCLTTYENVVKNADKIASINWNLAVFDEADFLFKPDNKSVIVIKNAIGNAFKLLLTPTPITMSIMDIYGLIHFIDETLLPDADSFYKRYFRKPENYPELSSWVSQFAFRTLKKQVEPYVNFTKRLPFVLNYSPQDEEKQLYDLVAKYLSLPNKTAYPQMDNYQLALQFYHTLSSSPQAFGQMLEAPIERAENEEKVFLQEIQKLALKIKLSAKMQELLTALKTIFAHLKSRKETQKVLIFVENSTSLAVLADLLQAEQYTIITHTDKNALEKFREDKNIQIFLTNDTTAKGLDIEYCPVVINYDLLYNAVEMEQRICRCHRQGQNSDVLVVNLLSKENMSDVRILELINKRTLQFQGIFGMSDDIVGNFDEKLSDVLQKRRTLSDIQNDFMTNMNINKDTNAQIVSEAESVLFTTFTKDIAEKVQISPKYIQEQAEYINQDLWEVVKFYFEKHFPQYIIDDTHKTLTLSENCSPPCLFYYSSGNRNVPYTGKKCYGMLKDFKPASNRITLTSILMKGILEEIKCSENGKIKINGNIPSCEISMYNVELWKNKTFLRTYDILFGLYENGNILSQDECEKILAQPVESCEETGQKTAYWLKLMSSSNVKLPNIIEETIKKDYLKEQEKSFNANIDIIKMKASRQKSILEQNINIAKAEVKKIKDKLSCASDRLEELKIQKQLNCQEKDLRKKEESLFLEQMRIEAAAEEEIEKLSNANEIFVNNSLIFRIRY